MPTVLIKNNTTYRWAIILEIIPHCSIFPVTILIVVILAKNIKTRGFHVLAIVHVFITDILHWLRK